MRMRVLRDGVCPFGDLAELVVPVAAADAGSSASMSTRKRTLDLGNAVSDTRTKARYCV